MAEQSLDIKKLIDDPSSLQPKERGIILATNPILPEDTKEIVSDNKPDNDLLSLDLNNETKNLISNTSLLTSADTGINELQATNLVSTARIQRSLSLENSQFLHQDSSGILNTNQSGDRFGTALMAADFNGDGYTDLAVSVPGQLLGTAVQAGQVQILYGSATGLTTTGNQLINQSMLGNSPENNDQFGSSLAAGDFDGDGHQDLVIGTPLENLGTSQDSGVVNVVYGSTNGLNTARRQLWHQDISGIQDQTEYIAPPPGDDVFIEQIEKFGSSVATGDFNGDGYDDLLVGVPGESVGTIINAGAVHAIYGSATGLTATGNQFFNQNTFGIFGTSEFGDFFGSALATGDFNGDGYDDAAIGIPGQRGTDNGGVDGAGAVQIIYGSANKLSTLNNQEIRVDTTGVTGVTEIFDSFGKSLAAGDFNNDGYEDLVVGIPGQDVVDFNPFGSDDVYESAGAVQVFYGTANGLDIFNSQIWTKNSTGVEGNLSVFDEFGASLSVGDFNADGIDDVAIGSPKFSATGTGTVNILYGSNNRLTANQDQLLSQNILGGTNGNFDQFGSSLAAGDFNGDGQSDLGIGIPGKDISTTSNTGAINVVYGSKKATYDLSFNTSGQSIWSSGNAQVINDERFFGERWNKSFSESVDLELISAGAYGSTSGEVGLQSKLQLNTGSVNASLPIDLTFDLPNQVKSGQTVTIGTNFLLDNGATFSTIGPTGSYSLDLLFKLSASLGLYYDPLGFDREDKSVLDWSVDESRNLLKLDSSNLSTSIPLGGYGNLDISMPQVNTSSVISGTSLSSTGSDNVLSANLDLDRIATDLLKVAGVPIPALEGSYETEILGGDFGVNYNIMDLGLNAEVALKQQFGLEVDKLTGQLILENGQAINFTVGNDITFVVPENIGNSLEFTAVLNMDANFSNKTQINYDVDLGLQALSLGVTNPVDDFSVGPLINETFNILDGGINVYNQEFDLGGFNSQSVNFAIAAVV